MSWEDSCSEKESLISEAESVARTDDFRWGSDQMANLMDRWKSAGSAGPDNDRLWDAFHSARQDFFDRREADKERRQRERDDNKAAKERIISEARSLARSTDWAETHEALNGLRADWKDVGSAGRDENDRLWAEFNSATQEFYTNRKHFYERREREWKDNASKKERLVGEAKSLSGSTDWKDTHEELKKLRNQWKDIGRASRDDDDRLWAEFNAACNAFYENRKRFYEKREREWKENASKKEDLVSEARSLAKSTDWKATHEALQRLRDEWKKIGRAGKDDDDRLWATFNDACNGFYESRAKSFAKREAERQASQTKKEGIVRQARNLATPSNWDTAHEDMKDLREDWKKAGSAGKADSDLWEEFSRAQNTFYANYKTWKAANRNTGNRKERDQRDLERTLKKAFGAPDSAFRKLGNDFMRPEKKDRRARKGDRPSEPFDIFPKPPRGGPRTDGAGNRIGHHDTKRERRQNESYADKLYRELRPSSRQDHHSHPTSMGGEPRQQTTSMKTPSHQLLHRDQEQFFRMRGVEIGGKSGTDLTNAFGAPKLTSMMADFYVSEQPNGGSRYSDAAKDFFSQHPHELDSARERAKAEKSYLDQGLPQDHSNRLKDFYKDRF